MKKFLIAAAIIGVMSAPVIVASPAMAEDAAVIEKEEKGFFKKRMERFNKWRNATPEEREAMKEKREAKKAERKAKWDAMSDEEKAAAKAKHKEHKKERRAKAKEKYNSLSDEQKAKVRKHRAKAKHHRKKMQKKRPNQWENINE